VTNTIVLEPGVPPLGRSARQPVDARWQPWKRRSFRWNVPLPIGETRCSRRAALHTELDAAAVGLYWHAP